MQAAAEVPALPRIRLDFTAILDLQRRASVGEAVNVIGCVASCGKIAHLTAKDGRPLVKRALILRDAAGYSVEVTLWGDFAIQDGGEVAKALARAGGGPVILVCKGVRLGEYLGGRQLGTNCASM